MSDLTFASPERRSYLLPVLLSVAALILAAAVAIHFFPATTVDAQAVHTDLLPTKTVYKKDSIVVGLDETSETLFIIPTIRVENGMRTPVYVDTISLTLTDSTGAELTEKSLSKQDIAIVEQSFPKITPLIPPQLLQDATVNPGKSAQGASVFSLAIPKTLWDARKSAVVKIDLYHQQSVFVTLPKL